MPGASPLLAPSPLPLTFIAGAAGAAGDAAEAARAAGGARAAGAACDAAEAAGAAGGCDAAEAAGAAGGCDAVEAAGLTPSRKQRAWQGFFFTSQKPMRLRPSQQVAGMLLFSGFGW